MKFEIFSRFNGSVQFTAEIECEDTTPHSVKVGLAVKWGLANKTDLGGANLSGANLRSADLGGANLSGADLGGANLSGADLGGADLRSANLRSADLGGANLSGANLRSADLGGANLSGANLGGADLRSANLRSADLGGANLSGANLRSADLGGANLSGADLGGADLRSANLRSADLGGANLSGANLSGAKGVSRELSTPLMMLLDQPGKIRAYKLVNSRNEGPFNGGVVYTPGESVEVEFPDTSAYELCGTGIHVATLDWCLREWTPSYKILIVEFEAADIAAIPFGTDGKFRLRRCLVVGEKELDYKALGLVRE